MWFFTMKKVSESRPTLMSHVSEEDATTARAAAISEFPDAELSEVFEEAGTYQCTFPHVNGECTNLDGSLDLLWSDGVRTPKPA